CDQSSISSINVEVAQTYYIYAVNTEGYSDVYVTSIPLLDVTDNDIQDFEYYPNPTTGKLSFKGKDRIDSVQIYNVTGQKILEETIGSANGQIDLTKFPTGLYLMQVE